MVTGFVKPGAATLNYIVEGTGSPVLIIGSANYYSRTFSGRLRERFKMAFTDLRHFAEQSSRPSFARRLTFEICTGDIEQVRSALGFEKFMIIGHSHHGNIALEYAKRFPERVSHVVMIGSPPVNVQRTIEAAEAFWTEYASEKRKSALRRNREALEANISGAAMSPAEAFIAEYVADGPKYWYDTDYDASWLWRDVPVNMDIIRLFRDLFADYELSWNAENLKAPVLVVMGRHDYVVPHLLWRRVLPKLKNVTFHLFEQSGHTPQLEEPELFDRILLEWLENEGAA
jgi:proline iminopeptidase